MISGHNLHTVPPRLHLARASAGPKRSALPQLSKRDPPRLTCRPHRVTHTPTVRRGQGLAFPRRIFPCAARLGESRRKEKKQRPSPASPSTPSASAGNLASEPASEAGGGESVEDVEIRCVFNHSPIRERGESFGPDQTKKRRRDWRPRKWAPGGGTTSLPARCGGEEARGALAGGVERSCGCASGLPKRRSTPADDHNQTHNEELKTSAAQHLF
mmetsp:Transcript_7033/g.17272  ORF Transcript_7033/g.17272 Transcript_7033/m.17272 type:complete len:215 (+) Transcript_7033:145-789(+)